MHKSSPLKKPQDEQSLLKRRWFILFIFMLICTLILLARLMWIQIYKENVYATLAKQNSLDLVPIEPERGTIFDRNGVILADNTPIFSLDFVISRKTHWSSLISDIGKIIELSPSDIKQFYKQLKERSATHNNTVTLKFHLTEKEIAILSENQFRFSGMQIRARLMRHYPFENRFAHVVGYVGRINAKELEEIDPINYSASLTIGKNGIEQYYEEALHGTVGYEEVENDAGGHAIRLLRQTPAVRGEHLYLSIDSHLQWVAEQAMGDHRGAIVALNPQNGEVLAMVSQPSFDPNLFVTGISEKNFKTLNLSIDKPLYNRALRGTYPFASTIKPYFALAGLLYHVISPEFSIIDRGWYQLKNSAHIFHGWNHHGLGSVNMTRAIITSSDIYFYDLAVKLGIQKMDAILHLFGFGEPTGIDLEHENAGIVASPDWKLKVSHTIWYPGDTVISGIGQGSMQATPLQLAQGVATLAMHGKRFLPTLLLKTQTPDLQFHHNPPTPLAPIDSISDHDFNLIIQAMENVVSSSEGTGRRLKSKYYTVAAKTGTGQVFSASSHKDDTHQENLPERLRDHHILILFSPVDHPKIALAIVTENSYATLDVAKIILDDFYGIKKYEPPQSTNETE